MRKLASLTFLLFLGILYPFYGHTAKANEIEKPVIIIIIDDIGYRMREDLRAIGLPGQVAFAIMPHSPHARQMSALANEMGKDVLLHMPMQALEENKNKFLGPGALTLQMTHEEFIHTLESSLRSVPHASGVNNHMGSLLTQHPGHMNWLMESLKSQNKFYIDSVTSGNSIAADVAKELQLPYLRRDVFLDNIQSESKIQIQFDELIAIAKRNGVAVAIGHPYPRTLSVLSKNLQLLDMHGVKLISPRQMLARKKDEISYRKVSLRH
ncbi:MAG: polysaccharide deacetylase 2 family uncharacterized protein YibQ [Planctomycetota bacterium]|jgi:polysaccharide deacetylase 2 family uncharacterized protein YibQ